MKILSLIIATILFINTIIAQSTDPDNPTILTEGQLTVSASGESQSYYFAFSTPSGEIKLTGDGWGKSTFFYVYLQNEDFKNIATSLDPSFYASTPLNRTVRRVKVEQPQNLILKITTPKETNTSLKLRIEGAVTFDANAANNSQASNNATIQSTTTDTNNSTQSTTAQGDTQQEDSNNSNTQTYREYTEEEITNINTILVTLKSGTTTEGVYNEYTIDNSDPKKLVLTIRGRNVPDMSTDMVSSIEIFGTTREASAMSKEENKPRIVLNGSPMGTSGQFMLNKKITVKTQSGKFINGTYSGYSYSFNGFKNKYTITLKGKNLPKFEVNDVKSIVFER